LPAASPDIEIRAIGIVKEVDAEDKRVYVDWLLMGLKRFVPGNGCFASIHGPFSESDAWTNQVFRI
jgi:hypothetical protein